jgi:hypothetical protein
MSRRAPITSNDPRLPAIVQRLRSGVTLTSESTALGYRNNAALRAALRALLGRTEYDALMAGRHGLGVRQWRASRNGTET